MLWQRSVGIFVVPVGYGGYSSSIGGSQPYAMTAIGSIFHELGEITGVHEAPVLGRK